MLGFNWVDAVIVVLLGLAVWEGVRMGIISQVLVIAGFFATLFVAGWLFPYVVRFHDPTLRTLVNALLVLLAAIYVALRCFDVGQRIHWSVRFKRVLQGKRWKGLETLLGCLPGLLAGLILVWLLAVMMGRLPFARLSNSVTDAQIVQALTRILPPVPAVFAEFDRHIDPNAQPYVSVRPEPQPSFNYSPADFQAAAAKGAASTVRITSFSCGGIVSGSGFAVGQGLVATNAHVIAGSKRPIVKYHGQSYDSAPIYFDANLDVAILKVPGLPAPALRLAPSNVALNSTVAVVGYPGGNYHAQPGVIRDTRATSGASIYNQGIFGRGLYLVQTHVNFGNSGGPIVMSNGLVAGIIFSKSTDVPDAAYALTSVHIDRALQRAQTHQTRVGTGACMVQ
ncbi:MAG TPA: MarP family serine protease [Candidatus Saccharimonadales bacterium]|nr:MarP family serine protease [Candidatus Saccharimonadales bacterium]